jgi:hypothetical protein
VYVPADTTSVLSNHVLWYPSPAAVDQHTRICGIGFDADAVLTRGQPAYNASVDVVKPQFVRKLVIRGSNTYQTQPVAARKAVLWASLEAAKARIFRRW